MKILVVSDTHGRLADFYDAITREEPFDLLLHCGDVEGDEDEISLSCRCPVYIVKGNNDYFSNLKNEQEIRIGGHNIFLTHGHYYYVSMSPMILAEEAASRGCDIAIYGHTHKPYVERGKGVLICNPGSLSYPRQEGRRSSYLVMTIDENDEVSCEIRYLD